MFLAASHAVMRLRGILSALGEVNLNVPMVVRLVGTNAEEGRQILADADMITARLW
jgi:succinyl-CoA synthetase beta subunit